MSRLLNFEFASSLDSGTVGVDTAFAFVMFISLMTISAYAFFGPSQRPIENLDLILHARLWSEVVRLDLVLLLRSSLHPLQACRRSRHCEVVAVHRQFQLPVHVLEIARTGQPSLEAALLQKRRVLLNSIVRGISGSIQAQVESRDLALITQFEVLDGNLYVDWPCGLGANHSQGLQWRGGGKRVQSRICLDLPADQPGSVVRVPLVAFVDVTPLRHNDLATIACGHPPWHLVVYLHIPEELHF